MRTGPEPVEERYLGDLEERCDGAGLQTRTEVADFELVLRSDDGVHYATNVRVCEPDAVAEEPDRLVVQATECEMPLSGSDEAIAHDVTEGVITLDDGEARLLYRWTRPLGPHGMLQRCEVDNVLSRVP